MAGHRTLWKWRKSAFLTKRVHPSPYLRNVQSLTRHSITGGFSMTKTFITYYRNSKQLHTSKLNGFAFVSFGVPVGQINGAICFESVTVTIGGKRERVVTADDFGGPVSICVETPGQPPQWFGLTDVSPTQVSTPTSPFASPPSYFQEMSA